MKRLPFHYSWMVLLAGTVGWIMSSPGQTFAVSIFIEHFIRDLGISRSLISTLYTAGTLAASVGLPLMGHSVDRHGTGPMALVVAVLLGLVCVYMGSVNGALMLGLGFLGLRLLGQGSMDLVSSTVVNHWWVRRRGLALGIAGVVMSVATAPVPALINGLIEGNGWRASYRLLGLAVVAVMVPVAMMLFRRPPEDYGLEPDGGLVSSGPVGDTSEVGVVGVLDEENFTPKQAMRTPAFWIAGLGFGIMHMLTTGLHFHMISIGADAGLSASEAATIYMPMALTMSAVSLITGILIDRVPVRFVLAAALILQSVSLVMAPLLSGVTMAFVYGIVMGTTQGLWMTSQGVIWAGYFGRRHLGAITGAVGVIMVAGSALGPMPFGIARDLLGSYRLALFGAAAFPMAIAVLVLNMKRPRKAV